MKLKKPKKKKKEKNLKTSGQPIPETLDITKNASQRKY